MLMLFSVILLFCRWACHEWSTLVISFSTRHHLLGFAATRHEIQGWAHIFALAYTDDRVTWVEHLDDLGSQKVF